MKIVVVGAEGAVGSAVMNALRDRHEVIKVGRSSGDLHLDVESIDDIRALYQNVGKVDAVIATIGHGYFGPVAEMQSDQFLQGIAHKVMPQVNLVLEGVKHMNDGGSFTLTSGVLNRDPIRGGAAASAANGAIDSFVLGASVDMPRGIRINAVSPGLLDVSVERYEGFFTGFEPVSSERVGLAYLKSVEGANTGQVLVVD
jgi:NAD(P)-dependent dehydrogenase (short-subunit alcohol dehydrogenase family)